MLIRAAPFSLATRRVLSRGVVTTRLCVDQIDDLAGKRVFVRADLNVPFSKEDPASISDDTRVRGALPTLSHLTSAGAQVVLASHLGRPKGQVNESMRLTPVAARLMELLPGVEVRTATDCIGEDVKTKAQKLGNGEILLLENVRFHPGEEKNNAEFVKALADATKPDIYVNDAFGAAHRAHASTAGITDHVPVCAAGILMNKELQFLEGAVNGDDAKRPLIAVVGGAKVSSKISVIESLLERCDKVLIGGGMAFTFLKALGHNVGSSLVEEEFLSVAKAAIDKAEELGKELLLPVDAVAANKFDANAETQAVEMSQGGEGIPDGWLGLDIGPDTVKSFSDEITRSGTCVWNGPMGVFEFEKFAQGTLSVASSLAEMTDNGGISIVGGGDSVAAVNTSGVAARISHISTGGGASLELLEGKTLPGVDALDAAN